MPFRALKLVLALSMALAPELAHADDRHRVFGGGALDFPANDTSVRVGGVTRAQNGSIAPGLELGASTRLLSPFSPRVTHFRPDFGIFAITRLHGWSTAWSSNTGESRGRVEVAVGPEGRLNPRHDITFRVALPFGYSKAWIHTVPGCAVRSAYEGGHGYVIGAVTACEYWVNEFGGYVGLSYAARVNWFDYHTELIAPPHTRFTERHRFRVHGLAAAAGIALRF